MLRVTPEDPSLRSVVCLGRGTTVLPISPAYDAFVRKPTGVIERAVGHAAFRVDVSAPIDDGRSWQLGLYMAHRLKAAGRLAEDGEPADMVLWTTGAVDGDLRVQPVTHMAEKQRRSAELFAEAGHRVLVVVPVEHVESLSDLPEPVQSLAVGTVAPLLRHLGLEPPLKPYRLRRRTRWPLLGGTALAALVAGSIMLIPRPEQSPSVPLPGEVPAVEVPAVEVPLGEVLPGEVVPGPVTAAPAFDPSAVTLLVLEARPGDGAPCGVGDRLEPVDPGQETPPGVCAVAVRAVNGGLAPGFVWLVALAEGTFREYAGNARSVETAVGPLGPGEAAEVRVAAPSWVRRPVVFRVLLVLAAREDEQVSVALAGVDALSTEQVDRLAGQLLDLGLEVRTIRHRVQPRR